jgi:hypothetical protein
VEAVTAIAERTSAVIVVDEVSLIKVRFLRVKIRARDIIKIKGYLEVFIEGEGHDIKFELEIPPKRGTARQEPISKDDKSSDGDFAHDEADDLSEFEEDQTKEGPGGSQIKPDAAVQNTVWGKQHVQQQEVGERGEQSNRGVEGISV